MLTLSLSSCSLYSTKNSLTLKTPHSYQNRVFFHNRALQQRPFSSLSYNPLRVSIDDGKKTMMNNRRHGFGTVCYYGPLTHRNLQWISTISTAVLMLARGTAIHKSFLVPLFALQAPESIVSWIKGEYGIWTAFLALLVRLFFFIPGELELPFITLLLIIVCPHQITRLRGTQEGITLSLVIAVYLAFQHFSRAGSLRKAIDQGSILATLAVICIVAVLCLLLI
ncbi:cold-regulated 413 inner membrane protein 1, chloroplastic-like [Olea europaea var. sylvestris]|uniref:cold-regulated 413 inner membrane protein 1, chloroplastic-like n=1 Tax=Olea europaea var. sylvestris TaxID=158386 RepID=UPI000C1CE251|nr:cold-regulated 413 inner membrane protein 1, chloroplastic-like [Olea europaea var. sylvestris]